MIDQNETMDSCVVYCQQDQTLAVLYPASGARLIYFPDCTVTVETAIRSGLIKSTLPGRRETDDDFAFRIGTNNVPANVTFRVVRIRDLPPSIRFQGAWRLSADGQITVDLAEVRSLILHDIRAERNARLDATDREWLRLSDVGHDRDKHRYAAFRQQLRDIPALAHQALNRLDAIESLEHYCQEWPTPPTLDSSRSSTNQEPSHDLTFT